MRFVTNGPHSPCAPQQFLCSCSRWVLQAVQAHSCPLGPLTNLGTEQRAAGLLVVTASNVLCKWTVCSVCDGSLCTATSVLMIPHHEGYITSAENFSACVVGAACPCPTSFQVSIWISGSALAPSALWNAHKVKNGNLVEVKSKDR